MRKNCPYNYKRCFDADARSVSATCRRCRVSVEKVILERDKRERLHVVLASPAVR